MYFNVGTLIADINNLSLDKWIFRADVLNIFRRRRCPPNTLNIKTEIMISD